MKRLGTLVSLTVVLIILLSVISPIISASCVDRRGRSVRVMTDGYCLTVEKKIIIEDMEYDEIEAELGDVIRFRINVIYNDVDGAGIGYKLQNVTITDRLPNGLEYLNEATEPADQISIDGQTIFWDFIGDFVLYDKESYVLEFNAGVTGIGTLENNVQVNAVETCYGEPRYGEANATVISTSTHDYVEKDVDDDYNNERAYDSNDDLTDGYENYYDQDGSSDSVLSKDGDNDFKIDHFININPADDSHPDRYWDPDDDVLSDIDNRDVDYDGTVEYVYDSDGDFSLDKYLDPDDGMIYPYIVHTLTVNVEGTGSTNIDPDGYLFLDGFIVTIEAEKTNSDWDFDFWSGDLSGSQNPKTITMDSDKSVTANFKNQGSGNPTVEIIKPKDNLVYYFNIPIRLKITGTKIVGPIRVIANTESSVGVEKVEFYLNDELQYTDSDSTFGWSWNWWSKPLGIDRNYTIKVKVYDNNGKTNTDEISVKRVKNPHMLTTIALIAKIFYGRGNEVTDDTFWDDIDQNNLKKLIYLIGGLLAIGGILMLLRGGQESEPEKTEPVETENEIVNEPPVAQAGGPYYGFTGDKIGFDGSESYDPDSETITYLWDFGDGNTSTGAFPTHIYENEGVYNVVLKVTDENGSTDEDSTSVEVNIELVQTTAAVGGEDNTFWYVVSGLSITLLSTLGLLYFRRKLYV